MSELKKSLGDLMSTSGLFCSAFLASSAASWEVPMETRGVRQEALSHAGTYPSLWYSSSRFDRSCEPPVERSRAARGRSR